MQEALKLYDGYCELIECDHMWLISTIISLEYDLIIRRKLEKETLIEYFIHCAFHYPNVTVFCVCGFYDVVRKKTCCLYHVVLSV